MAPCGWTVGSCGCGNSWNTHAPAAQARAQAVAGYIMWAATGRRFGLCEITVMPPGMCAGGAPDPDTEYRTYPVGAAGGGLLAPVVDRGLWYNRPRGGCCTGGCEVALEGPTTTAGIVSVTVGGVVVDEDAYVVQDGYLLVRTDGACWPCCSNWSDPSAAFTVVYRIGEAIPAAVQAAFETLACELAKACAGSACALPRTVTRLTRQGVDVEMAELPTDPGGLIMTGLPSVDQVIRAVNPNQLAAPPMVLSPDTPRPRRVT